MGMSFSRASDGWHDVPAGRAIDEFVVGLDVGQAVDPSAIAIIHYTRTPLKTWKPDLIRQLWKQDKIERFDVVHLERIPLGTPYPTQIEHVRALLSRPPLDTLRPKFVLDETGCGRPVADLFDRAGLLPERVLITAGNEVVRGSGARSWHVPKSFLIAGLDARLHCGELKIAAALRDASILANELKDFERSVSQAGRTTWNARVGAHDDLILAVAIALFACTYRNETIQTELKL